MTEWHHKILKCHLGQLNNIKTTGKHWLYFIFFTSLNKKITVLVTWCFLLDTHQLGAQWTVLTPVSTAVTDLPQYLWWTISYNHTIFSLSWHSDTCYINSLAPGRCGSNFKRVISDACYRLSSWALHVMLFSVECHSTPMMIHVSTLVQIMAWCCQETNYYLSQCWLGSMLPFGVSRPHPVKHYLLVVIKKMTNLATFMK